MSELRTGRWFPVAEPGTMLSGTMPDLSPPFG